MKAFTKLMAILLTLCILMTSLAACNKTPEPEPEPEPSSSEEPIEEPSEEPSEEEPSEDSSEEWSDPYEEEWSGDEEKVEEEDIDLAVIAQGLAKTRVAIPSNGMPSNERVTYILSPVDLGADRTGQEDCTEEIIACLQAAENLGGGVVYMPAGYYRVETNEIIIPSGVTLRGEWVDPDTNDMSKATNRGTVLMAYEQHDPLDSLESETGFINLRSAATLRNISIWYPEQDATNPQMYPYSIKGSGHTVVMNVTLYNSYRGFYNSGCSSMLIRGFYGTILNQGIFGSEAYDIPRIEKIRFDTKYWAESGLPNAPASKSDVAFLENYCRQNTIGIKAGRQDWGYWYDIYANNVRYAVQLVDGNDAIGKLVTRNAKVGVYIENISYPGLILAYCDIEASQAGVYYLTDGNETLSVSNSRFSGSDNAIRAVKTADYGLSFNQCTFENWEDSAIYADAGHMNISNTTFADQKVPFNMGKKVAQAVLVGNTFKNSTLVTGEGWSDSDVRIVRDDDNTDIPLREDNYNYEFAPLRKAATNKVFDVADYGAVAGNTVEGTKILSITNDPETFDTITTEVKDSTAAIQAALNAAKKAGGGVVYLHGGYYRVEGSLTVPTGVELKGTFDGPHFGNGTMAGTQIYAYGNKGNVNGKPLITMEKNSGVNGFTVYYPEQGLSDKAVLAAEKVKTYPATIRANAGTWIQNICFTGAYIGIDAMTNRCDGIIISDVTGCVMSQSLIIGHGTTGGWVQNFHFNYSSWSSNYYMSPDGKDSGNKQLNAATGEMDVISRSDLLQEYTRRKVVGVTLGDCTDVKFFSSFNIIIHTQIKLIEDPYTKGSFDGTMWGFAFDACHDGVYAESGDANLTFYESMGVFNQDDGDQAGGYNVHTTEDFTGTISVWNTDSWSPNSRGIAYVKGGTVNYIQGFPWCVYNGRVFDGATLNVLGTTFVANNDSKISVERVAEKLDVPVEEVLTYDWVIGQGAVDATSTIRVQDLIYHPGSSGLVVGNLSCKQDLNIVIEDGATVEEKLSGFEVVLSSEEE